MMMMMMMAADTDNAICYGNLLDTALHVQT